MTTDEQAVRDAVQDGFPAAVAALGSLIRIPSVAFTGFPAEPMATSAEAVAALFRATGVFPSVTVEQVDYEADVSIVADSRNVDVTTPALTSSLRGNVTFTLTVATLDHASHSGMFGGGVPDAMLATLRLLATLWDERGAVAVAGLTSTADP